MKYSGNLIRNRPSLRKMGSQNKCGACTKTVKAREHAITCDKCEIWFHTKCQDVSDELYTAFKSLDTDEIIWMCKQCKSEIKRGKANERQEKETKEKISEMEEMKKRLIAMIKELEKKIEKIKEEVKQEIEMKISEKLDTDRHVTDKLREARLIEETHRVIDKKFEEEEDKKKRKNNLVLYNVPESIKQNPIEREKDDEEWCQDLFENSLGIGRVEIVKVIRLGKNDENGRVRPMLVRLRNENDKRIILKFAKNLKLEEDQRKKKIGICMDLTNEEKEELKKLKEILEKKKRDGEMGWYIKNLTLLRARGERRKQRM